MTPDKIEGLPTKIGLYSIIKSDGKVKTRVVYRTDDGVLRVADNIGEYGVADLASYAESTRIGEYTWYGPMELPPTPMSRLNPTTFRYD